MSVMNVCGVSACLSAGAQSPEEEADPGEMGLEAVVVYLMWGLGTEFRSV